MKNNKNYIAIIAISEFGQLVKKRLVDYQNKSETDFFSDYFDISSQDDIDQLAKNLSKYELIIIIADLNDKNSYDFVSESLKLFDGEFILGFFNNYKNNFNFDDKFTSIINLSDLNPYEMFCAVKLIPDLLTIPHIKAVPFEDLRKVLGLSNIFEPKIIEFSNNQVNDNDLLNDFDAPESKSLIFCIYGNTDFGMNDFNTIEKRVLSKTKNNSLSLSSIIITNPKDSKNQLVILCGEDNVVEIEDISDY